MVAAVKSLFVIGFLGLASLGCSRPVPATQGDLRRVEVESGMLEGVRQGTVLSFKGVPYAAPPVGDLRWRPPQPPLKWTGVRRANRYGSDAPQKNPDVGSQSEDCLFLNVWAPADASKRPYPVMVWIHGGGLIQGSGRIAGEKFAEKGVVLVSINYRLGRLGSFAHPALLKQAGPGEATANYWLQDQIAALKWVQKNIQGFGGDPSRVTIFGVSAGGTSVNLLMASPLAKGLFHRAIAQSGVGGLGPYRRVDQTMAQQRPLTELGFLFAQSKGIQGDSDSAAAALRNLPWKDVARIGTNVEDREGFEGVVDGISLPDDLQKIFESGRQNAVPFIAGSNSFEGNLSLVIPWTTQPPRPEIEKVIDQLAPLYGRKPSDKDIWADIYGDAYFRVSARHLVGQMVRVSTPAYTYHFDYVRGRGRNSRGAGHGSEVPYVFGNVAFAGSEEKRVISAMQGHWIQFAKTGDPNGAGLPEWPAYTASNPATLVYGQAATQAATNLDSQRLDLILDAFRRTFKAQATASS